MIFYLVGCNAAIDILVASVDPDTSEHTVPMVRYAKLSHQH